MSNVWWTALAVVVWVVAGYGLRTTLKWRRESRNTGFRYHFVATGTAYLLPLAVIMTFYVLLALYVQLFQDRVSMGWLLRVELVFDSVANFVWNYFVFTQAQVMVALVVVFLVSCLLVRWYHRAGAAAPEGRGRLVRGTYKAIGRYHSHSVLVGVCLSVLASFTFFGLQLADPTAELALRISTDQRRYNETRAKIEETLSHKVTAQLYEEIQTLFPPSYLEALEQQDNLDERVRAVHESLQKLKSGYGVADPALEQLLAPEIQRLERLDQLLAEWEIGAEALHGGGAGPPSASGPSAVTGVPATGRPTRVPQELLPRAVRDLPATFAESTHPQIEAAADAWARQPKPSSLELLREGRKVITLHIAKMATEALTHMLAAVAAGVPLADPLLTALAETLDAGLHARLEAAYDRITRETLRNPGGIEATLRREADAIVAQTDLTGPAARARPQAEQAAARASETLAALKGQEGRLMASAADRLIADFGSSRQETVEAASRRLRVLSEFDGYELSKAQVGRLVSIMDNGSRRWSQSYRPIGAHCTDVTTTSVRYYAADVLAVAKSRHITPALRKRCVRVMADSKTTVRHHDPGWICFF